MTKPNRNELCPCGSGKKHKKCCGAQAAAPAASRGVLLSLAPVALLAGLGVYAAFSGSSDTEPAKVAPAPPPAAASPAAAKPVAASQGSQPAVAPPGKVWSPEHRHWHDAQQASGASSPVRIDMNTANPAVKVDGNAIRIDGKAVAAAAGEMRLPGQPDGPAPAGKVWSTEHGHWHDKPAAPPTVHMGTVNYPSKPVPAPGPAPPGMVWSAEHGHWHRAGAAPAETTPPATTTQPN